MIHAIVSKIRDAIKDVAWIGYHIVVLVLSAGIALSLPAIAESFLAYWSTVENEQTTLVTIEIAVAVFLIVLLSYGRQSVQDRKLAKMAVGAGLVSFSPRRSHDAQARMVHLKEKHATGRTVMVIGSSGYGTLVDQVGDLSTVLGKCVGAKVLLMNPYSREASARIGAIAHPDYTLERFREEVRQSIELLKRLKAIGKAVKLKLYSDPPLIKLVILGDYLWLQHYHTDLDVQKMPEYVLQHNLKGHGLYTLFHQYFVQRWGSTEIPEYDLDTDELVYRGANGAEIKRVSFGSEGAALPDRHGVKPLDSPVEAGTARTTQRIDLNPLGVKPPAEAPLHPA